MEEVYKEVNSLIHKCNKILLENPDINLDWADKYPHIKIEFHPIYQKNELWVLVSEDITFTLIDLQSLHENLIKELNKVSFFDKMTTKDVFAEIECLLNEGGLTDNQIDYLLTLETEISEGNIRVTNDLKKKIVERKF